MELFRDILDTVHEGKILNVFIGLNWTQVVVGVDGDVRCGLAATMRGAHKHTGDPEVPKAGELIGKSTSELVASLGEFNSPRTSLAMATLNALISHQPDTWVNGNAVDIIASQGEDKEVVLIGHFPFVNILRSQLDHLIVIDQNPLSGDYPANAAPEYVPRADLVAMTSMTLMNGTFASLKNLCRKDARVMLLGPSTPLSPVMFEYGVDWLAGSIIEDINAVMRVVSQGGNFRQVRRAGVRLVTRSHASL
jgi:uncharacterized protein (DUF4213/DUF364 family)